MKGKKLNLITGLICSFAVLCLAACFLYAGRTVETKDGVYNPVSERAMLSSRITPSVALNQSRGVCLLPAPDNMSENMEIAYETERNLKYGRILKLDAERLGVKQLRFAVLEGSSLKALDSVSVLNWEICQGDIFTCDERKFTASADMLQDMPAENLPFQ